MDNDHRAPFVAPGLPYVTLALGAPHRSRSIVYPREVQETDLSTVPFCRGIAFIGNKFNWE